MLDNTISLGIQMRTNHLRTPSETLYVFMRRKLIVIVFLELIGFLLEAVAAYGYVR